MEMEYQEDKAVTNKVNGDRAMARTKCQAANPLEDNTIQAGGWEDDLYMNIRLSMEKNSLSKILGLIGQSLLSKNARHSTLISTS